MRSFHCFSICYLSSMGEYLLVCCHIIRTIAIRIWSNFYNGKLIDRMSDRTKYDVNTMWIWIYVRPSMGSHAVDVGPVRNKIHGWTNHTNLISKWKWNCLRKRNGSYVIIINGIELEIIELNFQMDSEILVHIQRTFWAFPMCWLNGTHIRFAWFVYGSLIHLMWLQFISFTCFTSSSHDGDEFDNVTRRTVNIGRNQVSVERCCLISTMNKPFVSDLWFAKPQTVCSNFARLFG